MSVFQKGKKWVAQAYWCNEKLTLGVFGSREAAEEAFARGSEELRAGTSPFWKDGTASYVRFAEMVGVKQGNIKRWVGEGLPVDRTGAYPRVLIEEGKVWVAEHHEKSVAINRVAFLYAAERDDGAIKIGWTSDVGRRLRELQKDSNGKVVSLVAAIRGDKPAELKLHKAFAACRIDGEWYRTTIERVMEALKGAA